MHLVFRKSFIYQKQKEIEIHNNLEFMIVIHVIMRMVKMLFQCDVNLDQLQKRSIDYRYNNQTINMELLSVL
jgi:hypothetical protein